MAYNNKTIEDVYNLIIEGFQEKWNQSLRILPKSFIRGLAKVLAGVYIIPYKLCGWFYLQLFPDTADWNEVIVQGHKIRPLLKLGTQFGVGDPLAGVAWEGTISVSVVTQGRSLPLGTQLKSDLTGLIYCVSETTALDAATVTIPIYCTTAGTSGVLSANDVLKFVNPLGYIEQEATVLTTTTNGTDDETEAHYRNRVITRYSTQPQGGALSDYRNWAYDVAGVLQVYPYNDENSPGGVLIYVAGITDLYPTRVPDSALLLAVGAACTYDPVTGKATRKPITAILDPAANGTYTNVKAVTIQTFNVYITGLTGATAVDFGAQVKSELETYFSSREPYIRGLSDDNNRVDSVLRNSLVSTVNNVALSQKASFDTVTMNTTGSALLSYELTQGELAQLGNLYINGVLYEE